MINMTFINLPVKDLNKTKAFFSALGFTYNPQFTDEKAACMIINENTFSMLLVEPFFKEFTKKEIADAGRSSEVIVSLSLENRAKVDEMLSKVVAADGKAHTTIDLGWMYNRSFFDLDGHMWEAGYMDMNAIPATM